MWETRSVFHIPTPPVASARFERRTINFALIPPMDLWQRLRSIHGSQKVIQSYLWTTERPHKCWETRGLQREEQLHIANGKFRDPHRDFTKWLNNWTPLARLNK
jgi:hypothetical protein